MGFSRQEHWNGLTFLSPGSLPNPGIEHRSLALQEDSLLSEPPGKPNLGDTECSPILSHTPDHTAHHTRLHFSQIRKTKTPDVDALPDVKLAMTRLQEQRALQVFLDHVHLALVVYEIQQFCSV